ncbi:MAG: chemotaxis protein CheD [Lachnospiraceae bacterium]|nr:chemotaxis protein CheD [Lachnospiraceae bacterium]
MPEMIKVGMADLKVCPPPNAITTLGLGSCVGIALYDPITKIAGLAHIMLPDSTQIRNNTNNAKFADTGIKELVDQMARIGASRFRLVAKIAGGAQMFAFQSSGNSDTLRVGERNVQATKKALNDLGIRILAEDTGLNYGRTVEFYSETGEFIIKSVGKPIKKI